ncbi:hypothetical protein Y1Q_0017365 [Alligator mississippiensis]|uniref:Uncharacterized protein n=1 Tax=Alligator mississippiensis TaxID=8496 RepID=A0A151NGF4_ALLMI|nr:hypothetical protein Y1Q_0017365 [Alligator mississippiensis]
MQGLVAQVKQHHEKCFSGGSGFEVIEWNISEDTGPPGINGSLDKSSSTSCIPGLQLANIWIPAPVLSLCGLGDFYF